MTKMPSVRASIRVLLSPLIRFVSPTMSSVSEYIEMTAFISQIDIHRARPVRRGQSRQGGLSHRGHNSQQLCGLGSHKLTSGVVHCEEVNVDSKHQSSTSQARNAVSGATMRPDSRRSR